MGLIGMPLAGEIADMTSAGIRRALLNDSAMKPKLVQINRRAWSIDEDDLRAWVAQRDKEGRAPRPGRPKGAKNKKSATIEKSQN